MPFLWPIFFRSSTSWALVCGCCIAWLRCEWQCLRTGAGCSCRPAVPCHVAQLGSFWTRLELHPPWWQQQGLGKVSWPAAYEDWKHQPIDFHYINIYKHANMLCRFCFSSFSMWPVNWRITLWHFSFLHSWPRKHRPLFCAIEPARKKLRSLSMSAIDGAGHRWDITSGCFHCQMWYDQKLS